MVEHNRDAGGSLKRAMTMLNDDSDEDEQDEPEGPSTGNV